jgi:hypothetical protein
MQPVRNISQVLRSLLIERSLVLVKLLEAVWFQPEKMVGVVNSGTERLSGIAIHTTHMHFYEIQDILLLAPHFFFIQPQALGIQKLLTLKVPARVVLQEINGAIGFNNLV